MTLLITDYDYEPIIAVDKEKRILYFNPLGLLPTGETLQNTDKLIVEDCAHWLHLAITGHEMRKGPSGTMADCFRANAARAFIGKKAGSDPAYQFVREIVEQWGSHIIPWFNLVVFRDGAWVDAPDRWNAYNLHTRRKFKLAEHYSVEVFK